MGTENYDAFASTQIRTFPAIAAFAILLGCLRWYPRVRQACVQPRRFAAFGGVGFEVFMRNCLDDDPAPVIAFHGTADQVVPFTGGLTASTATAPPAEATMREWARRDGCRQYVRSVVAPGVTLRKWDECAAGTAVEFYRIRGGKHVWPRRGAVDASALMWEFFSKYRLE